MGKLVSVIIPTFNDSPHKLRKTIGSVLAQTYRDFEVIVVDDGSDLPFGGIQRGSPDSRLNWLALERNFGVARARNVGIEAAKGEYVAFLDTGDWWEPDNLRAKTGLFDKSEESVCLVFSGRKIFRKYGKPTAYMPQNRKKWVPTLLVRNPGIVPSCVLIRKEALDLVGGFYDKEDIPEDKDLWLRLAKVGNFAVLPEALVCYEVPPDSRSRKSPEKKEKTYKRFLEIHEADLRKYGVEKEAWAHYHWAIAAKYFQAQEIAKGLKHSILSLRFSWNMVVVFQAAIAILSLLVPFSYNQIANSVGLKFLPFFVPEYARKAKD